MNTKRTGRLASQLQREIADVLLRKISDPRLQWITLTRAWVSGDMHEAKIYFRTLEDGEKREKSLEVLKHAESFIRREMGHRLAWRIIPEIHFFIDEQAEHTEQVFKLLNALESERNANHGGTETGT